MMRSLRHHSWLIGLLCVGLVVLFVMLVPNDGRGLYLQPTVKKSNLKMETECRQHFEELFKDEFASCRPSFLKNEKTGHNLELDGFNERLKLAFEYNGSQHYFYSPFFHTDEHAFEKMKERDELKRRLCKKAGIQLITIPYTVRSHELGAYIGSKLGAHWHVGTQLGIQESNDEPRQ